MVSRKDYRCWLAIGLSVGVVVAGCGRAGLLEEMGEEGAEAALSTVLRVEAESMTLATGVERLSRKQASGGQVLFFWGGATASRTVTLSSAVDQLTVRAKGEQCGGAPTMVVRINGAQVMAQAVAATSYTLYRVSLPTSVTGTARLELGFLNDHFTATCDRNLFVDYVDLQNAGTVTPPPADVVVTALAWSPSNPVAENSVTFSATIKNQGGVATPAGVEHRVAFRVNGTTVSWAGAYTASIAPGASVTLTANGGPAGSATWNAVAGSHSVDAVVDDQGLIAEGNEANNTRTASLSVLSASPPPSTAPIVVVDDFESGATPAPWVFGNGAEFPGATGSLTAVATNTGKAARLAYDLSGGGNYVQMSRTLSTPLAARILRFSVLSPPNVSIRLRVVDSTGQTLQYNPLRPVAAWNASAWYVHAIDLARSAGHWGGANDGVVHNPITSVAILAGDLLDSAESKAGVVLIDDVGVADSLAPTLDPFAPPLAAPTGAIFGAGAGVNIGFTNNDTVQLDKAKAAGFEWVRVDLLWHWIEKIRGVYDWTPYSGLIAGLEARQMGALFILDYSNPLYEACAGCSPSTDAERAAYANFAKAAALQYAGKKVRFEIWNEPDSYLFWKPTASPTSYARLLSASVAAIKGANPQALVSTGGLSLFDFNFARAYLSTGAASGADAFGIHLYKQEGIENLTDHLVLLRAIVARSMPGKPLWDTETGFSSTWFGAGNTAPARHLQAVHDVRKHLFAESVALPLGICYTLRDNGTDPSEHQHNFGLIDFNKNDKPALGAVRTLLTEGKGRQVAGMLPTGLSTVNALTLDNASSRMVALWHAEDGVTYSVEIPEPARAIDLYGAPVPLVRTAGKTFVTLTESAGPVYLFYPR